MAIHTACYEVSDSRFILCRQLTRASFTCSAPLRQVVRQRILAGVSGDLGRPRQADARLMRASGTNPQAPPSTTDAAAPSCQFDIELAVTLGGCSFEAYNDPVNVRQGFVESAVNGTQTVYLDKDYLNSHITGLLQVHLKAATHLNKADPWGSSDPYAVITVGASSHRSAVVDRQTNPVWDEHFFVFVRDPSRQRMTIKVNDKDVLTEDDPLGSTMVSLADLCDGAVHALDLELVGGGRGRIQLEVQYVPMTDLIAEGASSAKSPLAGPLPQLSSVPRAWKLLAKASGAQVGEALQPVAYINNDESDTQLWVLSNPARRHVCIAWRGTEQTKWKDMLTDVSIMPSSFNPEHAAAAEVHTASSQDSAGDSDAVDAVSTLMRSLLQKGAGDSSSAAKRMLRAARQLLAASTVNEPLIHHGFLKAYNSVRVRVISLVEELACSDGAAEGEWTVYVTGHSLGGTLATLCAYELATRRYQRGAKPAVVMYNYGSPRVGNAAFASDFNQAVPQCWRVTNSKDIVPTVPRLMGYCHVGNCARLNADGSITLEELQGDTRAFIGEGAHLHEVLPDLAEAVLDGDEAARSAAVECMVEQEMALLNSIMDGSALSEHMEDFYLETIKQLVAAKLEVSPEVLKDITIAPQQNREEQGEHREQKTPNSDA